VYPVAPPARENGSERFPCRNIHRIQTGRSPQDLQASTDDLTMRTRGRITEWRDEQGYGFITPDGGGERVFLHVKALKPPARRPARGDAVSFTPGRDDKGRPRAQQVEYVSARPRSLPGKGRLSPSLSFALAFLATVAALALAGRIPLAILFIYLGLSILTFGIYAADKSAAQKGQWRTPEKTLQLLALAGGWPGALFAQRLLRHKSRKPSFQLAFRAAVIVNIAALAWLALGGDPRALAALLA
jgi:uncharacterized membrane protein YsdA (DUF1294 family)/cold shock CspA family protein